MGSMQNKVLARVRETIAGTGLEPVDETDWANTGVVRAMNDLDTEFVWHYNCQNGYVSAYVDGPAVRELLAECGVEDRVAPQTGIAYKTVHVEGREYQVDGSSIVWYHLEYSDAERVKDMIFLLGRLGPNPSATGEATGARVKRLKLTTQEEAVVRIALRLLAADATQDWLDHVRDINPDGWSNNAADLYRAIWGEHGDVFAMDCLKRDMGKLVADREDEIRHA